MISEGQQNKSVLLLTLVIFISRLPFLFSGYGSEEDAWGLILVARNIDLTGVYEVSRMPGHPVQELMLSCLWNSPRWILNLLTAIASSIGIYFFIATLRTWNIRNYLLAGIFMAFVPVFYINCTNIMDYTWALSLVMISMFMVSRNKLLMAGLILGLACGFRMTAGAMVIPFGMFLFQQKVNLKNIILFAGTTIIVALICFIPAFKIYGTSFITYYEYFPYPPFLKNVYKGTIGAWGIAGFGALIFAIIICIRQWFKLNAEAKIKIRPFMYMCIVTIVLYTYSFLRIPQKTAFVIPMIPFIVIIFAMLLERREMIIICTMMIISCFLFGINLDDKIRGNNSSILAIKTTIGNSPVSIDPLIGIVPADYFKRNQKITYARQVVAKMKKEKNKIVIIAGWWQNELNYFSIKNKNPKVSYLYYANEQQLWDSISTGNKIYFLPEQAFYNDLRFNKKFTEQIALPLN